MNSIIAKGTALFEAWLAPLVNLEYTLLLFATFIFHHLYFGKAHVITDFFALDNSIPVVVYSYGSIVLLASLIRLPEDWQEITTWLVFLGSTFISIAFNSLFYLQFSTGHCLIEPFYNLAIKGKRKHTEKGLPCLSK